MNPYYTTAEIVYVNGKRELHLTYPGGFLTGKKPRIDIVTDQAQIDEFLDAQKARILKTGFGANPEM